MRRSIPLTSVRFSLAQRLQAGETACVAQSKANKIQLVAPLTHDALFV